MLTPKQNLLETLKKDGKPEVETIIIDEINRYNTEKYGVAIS